MEEKEKTTEKEERLQCPYSELECESCQLFKVYAWGKGEKACVFLLGK